MARGTRRDLSVRVDHDGLIRTVAFLPIGPAVMNDAVSAVHGLLCDEGVDPGTRVQAVRTLADLGRLNLESARLHLEVEDRLGRRLDEQAEDDALEIDLRALGWEGGLDGR